MNILFELIYIDSEANAGVTLYAYNLVSEYAKTYVEDKISVLVWDFMESHFRKKITCENVQFVIVKQNSNFKNLKQSAWARVSWKYELWKIMRKYDVVVSPYANISYYGMSPFIRHIGVIHDLQMHKNLSQNRSKSQRLKLRLSGIRKIWQFSDIVVISKHIKKDVFRYAWKNATVIYNVWGNLSQDESAPEDVDKDMEYILDVNTFMPSKNAQVLVEAFALIKDDFPTLKLYLKGMEYEYLKKVKAITLSEGLADRVIFDTQERISSEMTWLYRHAKAFVSPSLMEGFGHSPLEAIMSGIPVLVSDIPIFHEVLEDCVSFFDPNSKCELAEKLRDLLKTQIPVDELKRRADLLSNKYSQESHISAYHQLIHR